MTVSDTRVRAVKLYLPDAELSTTVVRGIGFRGECRCGWKSGKCASYAMARGALHDHKRRDHRLQMDVETDPLAVYVVIELQPPIRVHGPFAFRHLAEKWADLHGPYGSYIFPLRPVLDDAPAAPEASRG